MLAVIWRWLNTVEIPPAIVHKVSVSEIAFCLDVVAVLLTGVLYALALVFLVKAERAFRMRGSAYISFAVGYTIAAMLAVAARAIWPLVYAHKIPLETAKRFELTT
jgi:uncharacterized membrane protein YesL